MSCDHIEEYKQEYGDWEISYKLLYGSYVTYIYDGSRRKKAQECKCKVCGTSVSQRIHACLCCVYHGCFENEKHIHKHSKAENHLISFDTTFGHIYCFACGDYKYDEEFEKIAHLQKLSVKLKSYWSKSSKEMYHILKSTNNPLHFNILNIDDTHIGLRGIVNLGHTCYIGCILQALIHAPVYRDYVLSGKHKCDQELCLANDLSKVVKEVADPCIRTLSFLTQPYASMHCSQGQFHQLLIVTFNVQLLAVVAFYDLEIVFNGKREPFIPEQFIYSIYKNMPAYATTKQNDAALFFLDLLNILRCQHGSNDTQANAPCNSIIEKLFTGHAQYKVVCSVCNHETSNVPNEFGSIVLNWDDSEPGVGNTLEESLGRYFHQELDKCEQCGAQDKRYSQTSVKQFPFIISIHVPRVSHVNVYCMKKEMGHIIYPEFLNMKKYLPDKDNSTENDKYKFYLYAVVVHCGKTAEGGHYKCYIKPHKKNWFKCDDVTVTAVNIEEVLAPHDQVSLLFYHKSVIDYEK